MDGVDTCTKTIRPECSLQFRVIILQITILQLTIDTSNVGYLRFGLKLCSYLMDVRLTSPTQRYQSTLE